MRELSQPIHSTDFIWTITQILVLAFSPNATDKLIQANFNGSNCLKVTLSLLNICQVSKNLFFT